MSTYVEAPDDYDGDGIVVFLAGGISACPDWQVDAAGLLADLPPSVAVLNPRRAEFPMHDPAAAPAQVAWEFRHLRRADVVLFWFPASPSPQPIALYELGAHAAAGKPIVVGADLAYSRRADVVLQLGHVRPEVAIHSTLQNTCAALRHLLGREVSTGTGRR